MNIATIALKNVSKIFHQHQATIPILNNINFNFHTNTSYALMGPSGVGKSTLLHMIAGIENPSQGEIEFTIHDQIYNQTACKHKTGIHKNIGIMFQNPSLIYELSVLENVMLSAITSNNINIKAKEKAMNLLSEIGMAQTANMHPHMLSGGQQQRIAILRTIFNTPMFLLADEPTGNLDENTAKQIITLLKTSQKKNGFGLVISTHDIQIAQHCDIILYIQHQSIAQINAKKI